ncbi:MAG: Type phosphodiesterase / nucleotide pyrophosphatase [Armatimonadetes bacterium]|nr:Type phosphodiesterase / nucleotide pyrophosphatase [Armatimonadota bacterium]
MNHALRPLPRLLATAATGLALAAAGAADAQRSTARKDQHVILITIDGFAAYNLDDARIPLPNLRRIAREGARADAMTVITPSVTWPDHTTLVTGVTPAKHGVLANGRIEPNTAGFLTINPRRSKEELCRATTVYDVAHRAGLKTAEINWPVTREAKTLDFSFPDHPDAIKYSTPRLIKSLVEQGVLSAPEDAAFRGQGAVGRDNTWTQAAVHLIKREKPNLLLFHLLNTDGQQHAHGPQSTEAFTALALADRQIGEIVEAVRAAGLSRSTSIFVTADHGFVQVTKTIKPYVRLRDRGLSRAGANGSVEYDAQIISEGGSAFVYVPKAKSQPDLVSRVRSALEGLEGTEPVVTPERYPPLGLPVPGRDPQAPDLVLSAKDGYNFSTETAAPEIAPLLRPVGSHGYLHTNPKVDALCIAAGAGIRKGSRVPRVRNVDIAPTIARLLGLQLPDVDGRVLDEFLTER